MKVKVMGRTWESYQPPTHQVSCYFVYLYPEQSYADSTFSKRANNYLEMDGSRHQSHYNILIKLIKMLKLLNGPFHIHYILLIIYMGIQPFRICMHSKAKPGYSIPQVAQLLIVTELIYAKNPSVHQLLSTSKNIGCLHSQPVLLLVPDSDKLQNQVKLVSSTMAYSRVSLLLFCICFFLTVQARRHNHVKHKHAHHLDKTDEIQEAPASAPQPNNPSNGRNAYNFTAIPPNHGNAYNLPAAPRPSADTSSPPNYGNAYNSTGALSPSPAPANPPKDDDSKAGVFDVRKFGAVGDGITDDTEAFKMAWDTACQNDSAVILVPYGFTFMIQSTIFTGPCQGRLVFQIDGTLSPPDGPDSWPQKNSKRQWLVFYRINAMSLQGGGVIDGRGQKWWDLPCKPHKVLLNVIMKSFSSTSITT